MNSEPGRQFNLHRVKRHRVEDQYQIKKEIKRLMHEGYLKTYVKGDSSHSSNKSGSHRCDDVRSPKPKKTKETSQSEDDIYTRHMLNTITRQFVGGRGTSFARKRYTRQILSIENLLEAKIEGELRTPEATVAFSDKDSFDIHPHNDDPMVINIKCKYLEIKRVIIDQIELC